MEANAVDYDPGSLPIHITPERQMAMNNVELAVTNDLLISHLPSRGPQSPIHAASDSGQGHLSVRTCRNGSSKPVGGDVGSVHLTASTPSAEFGAGRVVNRVRKTR